MNRAGECYRDAAEFLLSHDLAGAKLVHGIATLRGSDPPVRMGHAWIELGDDVVVDPSAGYVGRAAPYYIRGDVHGHECRRYDAREARKAILEHRTFGPWPGEPAFDAEHA